VIVADDLTGACDAAVQFRLRGAKSIVHLESALQLETETEVDAFSTNTRDSDGTEIEARIRGIADLFADRPLDVVFQKIDSVMRGNPGKQIVAIMDAFACEVAVITPAFPEMGRRVEDGRLQVSDDSQEPINVLAVLKRQGLEDCVHTVPQRLGTSIRSGNRLISLDAACNKDLSVIVHEALHSGCRILWVGSGGRASALAAALLSESAAPYLSCAAVKGPVLFCIGSDHAVTQAQLTVLSKERTVCDFVAERSSRPAISAALRNGRHVVLRAVHATDFEELGVLAACVAQDAGALLLSGGTTASMICKALRAGSIQVENEITPGVPAGVLRGGHFDFLPIATKSGGFGDVHTLVRVADSFVCCRN